MSALTLSGVQKAPINVAQKNQKDETNPKTVTLSGHRKAVVIISGISAGLALTAAVVASVFALYIVAAVAAAAFVAFSISTLVALKVNVSQKSLNDIEDLRKKAGNSQALTKQIEELKKQTIPTPQKDTPVIGKTEKNEESLKQLDDLRKKLKNAEEEVRQMTLDKDAAQQAQNKLKNDLAAKEKELQELNSSKTPNNPPTSPVPAKKQVPETDVQKLEDTIKQIDKKLKDKDVELKNLQTQLQKKETDLKASQAQLKNTEADLKTKETLNKQVNQQLVGSQNEVKRLKQEASRAEEETKTKIKEVSKYQEQLKTKDQTIADQNKNIAELQELLAAPVAQPADQTDKEEQNKKQLQKQIEAVFFNREMKLKDSFANERDKLLENKDKEQDVEIASWQKKVEDRDTQVTELSTKVEELKGQVETLNEQNADLTTRAKTAESELSQKAEQTTQEPDQQAKGLIQEVAALKARAEKAEKALVKATNNALIAKETAKPAKKTEQSYKPVTEFGNFEMNVENCKAAFASSIKNIEDELANDDKRDKNDKQKLPKGDRKELRTALATLKSAEGLLPVLDKQKDRKLKELENQLLRESAEK